MKISKENVFKILNGMGIGIVIALLPGAVLGKITELLGFSYISMLVTIPTTLMCLIIGFCIAIQFKLDTISSCTLAVTTMLAGGAIKGIVNGTVQIQGSGDVINATIGAILSLIIIYFIGNKLNAYKLLVLPAVSIVIVGLITNFTAKPVGLITQTIGIIIAHVTQLQPIIMSILIALAFSFIIVSPISTVAIALLIQLSGIGSAAANVGIASVGITLAILNSRTNGLGTALTHFIGSPKIQMVNFVKSPIMLLPGLLAAVISSIFVPLFNVQGSPMSAGFGLSGFIGPLEHLGIVGYSINNIIIAMLVFVIIPVIASFISVFIIRDKLKLVHDEYYRLTL